MVGRDHGNSGDRCGLRHVFKPLDDLLGIIGYSEEAFRHLLEVRFELVLSFIAVNDDHLEALLVFVGFSYEFLKRLQESLTRRGILGGEQDRIMVRLAKNTGDGNLFVARLFLSLFDGFLPFNRLWFLSGFFIFDKALSQDGFHFL